jgi:hypothetical protein
MNTQLLVNISGEEYDRLDIFEDIPISLVIQQSDLTDLTARRVPYSRVLPIPDTANNSRIFENYFEVNGVDFNPLNQVPCVVQYRGTDIFRGVLRLQAVITKRYERIYEIYILGDVSDFASEIRNYTLQQLDWTTLQHELNYSSVTTSWEASYDTNDGLFGGSVIYPLVHYGLDYQGSSTTPAFEYSFDLPNSFSTSGHSINPLVMKPAIKVKTILDKIFEKTSYNYVSDFFDTEYFQSIYMDTFQNGKLGIESASAVTNQNIFRVYSDTSYTFFMPLNIGSLAEQRLDFTTIQQDGYDPLGNFTLGQPIGGFDPPYIPNDESYFTVPYNGDYFWNFRFRFNGDRNIMDQFLNFRISARKGFDLETLSAQTPFYSSQTYLVNSTTPTTNVDEYFSGLCISGEYVALYIDFISGNGGASVTIEPFNFAGVEEPNIRWELYESPLLTGQNLVDFRLGILNINAFDYLKNLMTHFNLVVIQDEVEKQIRFEPYNWYYNDPDRTQTDWTSKIDLNSDYKVEPLSFDLSKQVVWTNQRPVEDFLNLDYFNRNDFVFGRTKYITNDNVFVGDQVYETSFGSVPTSGLTNAPNFIIPKFYYLNNGLEVPYQTPPHLFFWTGNRYAFTDTLKKVPGFWFLTSGTTPVQQTHTLV